MRGEVMTELKKHYQIPDKELRFINDAKKRYGQK